MSGEDDLRAAVASALRQHMDRGSSGRLIADYGIDASDLADAALDAIRLATPAEPARESDGVGLRLTEGENAWVTVLWDRNGRRGRLAEAKRDLEQMIAARVAEAGARALVEVHDAMRDERRRDPSTYNVWSRVTDVLDAALDRARGLGGAS